MKKILLVSCLLAAAGMSAAYLRADESKQRFIRHMVRQMPYLPGRYFA